MNQASNKILLKSLLILLTISIGYPAYANGTEDIDVKKLTAAELLLVIDKHEASGIKADLLLELSRKYYTLGDARHTEEAVKGLNMAKEYGNKGAIARGHDLLAFFRTRSSDYANAYDDYLDCIDAYNALGETDKVIFTKFNLADFFTKVGMYPEAEKVFMEVLEYYRAHDNAERVAKSYDGLALVFEAQGEYEKAINALEHSFAFYDNEESKGNDAYIGLKARNLFFTNECYRGLNDVDKALTKLDEALEQQLKYQETHEITARIYHRMAMIHKSQGEHAMAEEALIKSLEVLENLGNRTDLLILEGWVNLEYARLLNTQDKAEEANQLLLANVEHAKEMNQEVELIKESYNILTSNYQEQNNLAGALQLQQDLNSMSLSLATLQHNIDAMQMQYQITQAYNEHEKAIAETAAAQFRFYQWLVASVALLGLLGFIYALYSRIRRQRLVAESILRDFEM